MKNKTLQRLLKHNWRTLLLVLTLITTSQGVWAWAFKCANDSWTCNSFENAVDFYDTPNALATTSRGVNIKVNAGSGFNVYQYRDGSGNCGGEHLDATVTDATSLGSGTIIRAVVRWDNNHMYCTHTKIIPGGTIYVTPAGGSPITMTKSVSDFTYTAIVSFPSTLTFSISAGVPSGSITDATQSSYSNINQLALNYTGLTSSYSKAKITYNLETNQVTVSECTSGAPSNDIVEILNGTKIWFYAGIQSSWNKGRVYITDGSSNIGDYSISTATACDNNDSKIAAVKLPAAQYWLSHEAIGGWKGMQMASSVAGKMYVLGSSLCGLSSDAVTTQEGIRINLFKFDNSSGETSKTVDEGDDVTIYVSTENSVYQSPLNYGLEVRYYVKKDGENFYQDCGWLNDISNSGTSSGILTTDNLSGTYDVYALLMEKGDGVMAVKATSTLTLTVTPACTTPSVSTNSTPSSVSATSATLSGTVTEGGCSGEAGIVYSSTSSTPTVGGSGCTNVSTSYTSGEEYDVTLDNTLTAGTKYYYRAYFTVSGTTYYDNTVYSFYTKPANLYIKGLIIDSGSGCSNPWPFDPKAFNVSGNVFTKAIIARHPGCSYGGVNADAEFILSTTQGSENGMLNGKTTFEFDGATPNWAYSTRDGANENFKYSEDYSAGDKLLITVTFLTSGKFKMKMETLNCSTPDSKTISITGGSCSDGSAATVTVSSAQDGYLYTVYDALGVVVGNGVGGGSNLDISVTPTYNTTYTVKAKEYDVCETETEMGNTVNVTMKPRFNPSTNITPYVPITVTSTAATPAWTFNKVSGSLTGAWLSNGDGVSTVFKAPTGTYTVSDGTCNTANIVIGTDSNNCN